MSPAIRSEYNYPQVGETLTSNSLLLVAMTHKYTRANRGEMIKVFCQRVSPHRREESRGKSRVVSAGRESFPSLSHT